ncbi:MAG: DMT family transporter, partial [Oscillochloris sp.]|nr:DMT family transporter [Oscillochloris sp.]
MNRSVLPYVILFVGVLIASTSSILITGALNLSIAPLTVAAGRIVLASLILTPIAWGWKGAELRQVSRRDLGLAALAGISLAIHFASWTSSLAYTSVASSTALVTTNPVFVSLATWLILRERMGWGSWLGVLITVAGSALIALSDSSGGGSNPLLGDGLALFGAITVTGYLLLGRSLRTRISLLPYIWLVYTTCALVLLVVIALTGQSLLGLPPLGYLLILGLALGPQLLSHTSFNWALKYLSPTLVAVSILGEPIGSTILAVLIFKQELRPLQMAGGAVLLIGIAVATLAESRRPDDP